VASGIGRSVRHSACTADVLALGQPLTPLVVWFRGKDLRLADNPVLDRAISLRQQHPATTDIVPFFCYDPRWMRPSRCGPFRARYLVETVDDLRRNLRALGSDLVVASGAPEEYIPKLVLPGTRCTVFAQGEVASEEVAAERAVRRAVADFGTLELVWGNSNMYHPDDLRDVLDVNNVPSPATKFMKLLEEREVGVREPLPAPANGDLGVVDSIDLGIDDTESTIRIDAVEEDPRRAFKTPGGETAALDRWRTYLDSHAVASYFDTRNGMIGEDYSTKLGPALAHGAISPRSVLWMTRRYEAEHGANKSSRWIEFHLRVREYYKYFAGTHGDAIFRPGGPIRKRPAWRDDHEAFLRWKEGRTGWPLVDASMKELAATGFMSNRGRQIVASFLCHDLGLDWRLGARHFEWALVDYDCDSNWGNWVAAAGLTGGRVNIFNVRKQSKQYDERGQYVRLWLPELADVPADEIHEPRPGALASVR